MPENKATPTPEVKKPDAAAKAPGTPPSTEQKPPAPPEAPQAPKAAAPAEKKSNDPPKEPPKAPPAPPTTPPPPPPKAPPKEPEGKGKATEPKQAEVPKPADGKKPTVVEKPGEKKPDAKDAAPPPKAAAPTEPKEPAGKKPEEKKPDGKAPATDPKKGEPAPPAADGKGQPATDPKKPEVKAPATDPKGKPADAPKKEEAKGPITVSGKDKVEIPIEPKGKAEDPKGAPAADPKKKDTAVEPPKGVKITQIFADRLDKPTQEDLKSLPIPQEGEGFSMRLHPAYFFEFLNHPFSVNRETDDYRELYDSIKENGINEPIKARPREGGGLELISGHRRHDVAMQLNYPVPVVIVQADNDSAQIECVDGNLHRKDIPTSELARAAKMKIEAMTRKAGRRTKMEKLTSPQKRTDQIVAEEMGYSRTQLTRLVRIDSLVPEMKQMVDSKKLPFNVAVELSYMSEPEQRDLVSVIKKEQTVPSLAQALQMKEASQKAALAAKEAAKAPKPPLQVVSTPPKADQATSAAPGSADPKAAATTPAPTQPAYTPPAPAPAPKPPAPVDAKKFASIMDNAKFEFTAFIENLNRRTRGFLSGAHLSFPTTTELVQATLNIIGVDGLRNEEIIVTDYTISIPGLRSVLGEYASIDELNYLAHRIQGMTPEEQAKFVSALKHGEYADGLQDVINLTYNLDCYELIPEVTTYEEYGRYLAESQRDFQLPAQAAMYFDYASYGEDSAINEGGELTPQGYIYNNRSDFRDVYDGKNVPEEYRVFKYPMQMRAKQSKQPKPPKPPQR